jgi:hypothetical protein
MADAKEVAVLRMELQGVEPLIWRRVAVRTDMSLMDVHRVVQAAMGWLDCHLWHFETSADRYAVRLASEPEWNERYDDAGAATLAALVARGVRRFSYVYDMGDFWEHAVIVERSMASLPDVRCPQFLGGERRCPPEDCGGPAGYYEFLRNISGKRRKTSESLLRWYGGPYDPDDIGESKIVAAPAEIASGRGTRPVSIG